MYYTAADREEARLQRFIASRPIDYHGSMTEHFGAPVVAKTLGLSLPAKTDDYATVDQQMALQRLGVWGGRDVSRNQADALIAQLQQRLEEGLATVKQMAFLIALGGHPSQAREWTKEQAREAISRRVAEIEAAKAFCRYLDEKAVHPGLLLEAFLAVDSKKGKTTRQKAPKRPPVRPAAALPRCYWTPDHS